MRTMKLFVNPSFALSLLIALNITTPVQAASKTPNKDILGAATYMSMPLYKVQNAQVVWVDPLLAVESKVANPNDPMGLINKKVIDKVGFAAKAEGEVGTVLTHQHVEALVDANGGIGLNGNLGSGRAAIIENWQIKGSGKTMMVLDSVDSWHRNGSSPMSEGLWEAAWSSVTFNELPYGSFRILANIATGGKVSPEADAQPRVLIVREDPLRPAHYVLNIEGMKTHPEFEKNRIAEAMKNIVSALPKPVGYVSQNRQADFVVGVKEMIHRQAVQHGYMWSHSMMHGGNSPANAGLDGRMLDFGTFSAFDGYPRAMILDDDGYMGETRVIKNDVIKDIRDSWIKTLPADLLAVLPTQQQMFDQYDKEFDNVRHAEMLRLAGAFTEYAAALYDTSSGNELARTLVQMAEAGNEETIELFHAKNPFGRGTYNVGKVLVHLASLPLERLSADESELRALISDQALRVKLVAAYKKTFAAQREMTRAQNVTNNGESIYRFEAAQIRNHKLSSMYRIEKNYSRVMNAVRATQADPNSSIIADTINGMVNESRREFWDASPLTIVLSEKIGKNNERERRVLDGRTGLVSKVVLSAAEVTRRNSIEERSKSLDTQYRRTAISSVRSCSAIFTK